MSDRRYTGRDGWECTEEGFYCQTLLAERIRELPSGIDCAPDVLAALVRSIYNEVDCGLELERPRNIDVALSTSERELRDFERQCRRLSACIDSMHASACSGIFRTGFVQAPLHELGALLDLYATAAIDAWNNLEPEHEQGRRGRPVQQAAPLVALAAAQAYKTVTGREARYTTDPLTSQVSGVFKDFLQDVFALVGLPRSVSAVEHVKRIARRED